MARRIPGFSIDAGRCLTLLRCRQGRLRGGPCREPAGGVLRARLPRLSCRGRGGATSADPRARRAGARYRCSTSCGRSGARPRGLFDRLLARALHRSWVVHVACSAPTSGWLLGISGTSEGNGKRGRKTVHLHSHRRFLNHPVFGIDRKRCPRGFRSVEIGNACGEHQKRSAHHRGMDRAERSPRWAHRLPALVQDDRPA